MFSSSSAALVGFGFSLLAAALAPAADAKFASIQFSTVKQCGNFSVTFQGGKAPAALPLTLSVLPVNGTPVFIPLPLDAWNSTSETGAAITFLPLPEGTQFLASLDDANGRGTALVSDVLVIEASDSGDTSCLPTTQSPFVPRYSVNGTLNQCESFFVDFDATQNISSPTVRAFVPKGASFPVNETEATSTTGVGSYLMDVPRDSTAVLLFQDQSGYAETSTIFPVLGNVNSDSSCIPSDPLSTAATLDTSDDDTSSTHVTPKIAIVVIAACVGVIAVVAVVMIIWYFHYRRKAKKARKFTKLDEAGSPSARDPEKQMVPPMTSPVSPAGSGYGGVQQVVRDPPYIRFGSALITPTSPDPKDPFGEQTMGSILGPFSARESLNSRLGATALGNNTNGGSSTLAIPRSRTPNSPAVRSSGLRRSSAFDPATEPIPGTSPYWGGRLAVTPDNSLASNPESLLRRPLSGSRSFSSESVSSVEIDRILEMATIYGGGEIPDIPQPVMTAPATLRSSAYMAGRESRRQSVALSSGGSSPAHSRNNSAAVGPPLSHSASYSTLRTQNGFRGPPLAPLPSSPLASPAIRPSLDIDGATFTAGAAESTPGGLTAPPPATLARNASMVSRQSMYSESGDDFDGFTMLQPPPRRPSDGSGGVAF
ncbi:hypothetical protein L227DRAFT_609398 [Lentinus tigrinus ALCF2SS1-6]|uniref:Dystroglycan-type cadherin-like domain-containing protein n=1 Tax=Lentinus tigrinus ALCF2SS1-6 TaxID=1328759 RepID=A0A5C2SGG3_9APHY|nr:hypothetical protein L227DRAFT_609398 [Lentinus tigrinus ALCF2SS1-6]